MAIRKLDKAVTLRHENKAMVIRDRINIMAVVCLPSLVSVGQGPHFFVMMMCQCSMSYLVFMSLFGWEIIVS